MSMRDDDVHELETIFDQSPYEALRVATDKSSETYAARFEGRPIAVFGVVPMTKLGSYGSPWFLGTDELLRHPRAMLQFGRAGVAHWLRRYTLLMNFVSVRNTASIRWLTRIGFKLEEPVAIRGEMAHQFWIRRDAHVRDN